MANRLQSQIIRASAGLALLGAGILAAIAAMTVLSVTLRLTTGRPLAGLTELTEIACAAAIFCALPWAQVSGANVAVEFATTRLPARLRSALSRAGGALYLVIAALIAWRLGAGAADMHRYGEATMILRLPVWPVFAIILPAMAMLIAVLVTGARR